MKNLILNFDIEFILFIIVPMKDKRNKSIPLYLTETEKGVVTAFRDKLQLVSKNKVSYADACLKAILFATGKMPLK